MFEGRDAGSVSLLDLLSCMLGGAAILFVTFVAISTRLERGGAGSPVRPIAMTDLVKIEIPDGARLGKSSFDPQPASVSQELGEGERSDRTLTVGEGPALPVGAQAGDEKAVPPQQEPFDGQARAGRGRRLRNGDGSRQNFDSFRLGATPAAAIYELAFSSSTTMIALSGLGCTDDPDLRTVFGRAVVTWIHRGKHYQTSIDGLSCSAAGQWTASIRRGAQQLVASLEETCRAGWLGRSKLVATIVEAPKPFSVLAFRNAESPIEGCRLAELSALVASGREYVRSFADGITTVVVSPEVLSPRGVLAPWVDVALDVSPLIPDGRVSDPRAPGDPPAVTPPSAVDTNFVVYSSVLSRAQSQTMVPVKLYSNVSRSSLKSADAAAGVVDISRNDTVFKIVDEHARREGSGAVRFQSVGYSTCVFSDALAWPSMCYVAVMDQNPAR